MRSYHAWAVLLTKLALNLPNCPKHHNPHFTAGKTESTEGSLDSLMVSCLGSPSLQHSSTTLCLVNSWSQFRVHSKGLPDHPSSSLLPIYLILSLSPLLDCEILKAGSM